jgi:hypothetical protein
MAATGVYGRPEWAVLEDAFELMLLDARHVRQRPGHRADVLDAHWLCQLLEAGLLKPSLVPPQADPHTQEADSISQDRDPRPPARPPGFTRSSKTPGSSSAASPPTSSANRVVRCLMRGCPAPPTPTCSPSLPVGNCERRVPRYARRSSAGSILSTRSSSDRSSRTSTCWMKRSTGYSARSRSGSPLSSPSVTC